MARTVILVIALTAFLPTAASDSGDDFTNNLFSDLAPLLALFGERVAQQFMSQAMGWADITIFAMAPLGIITAIVGAIRVAGPGWLKSVIGRAREAYAVPELELLSSTSSDICELWNGVTLVKVLGSPTIIELIYFSNHPEADQCDVHMNCEAMNDCGIAVSKMCERAGPTTKRINLRMLKHFILHNKISRYILQNKIFQGLRSFLKPRIPRLDPEAPPAHSDIKPSNRRKLPYLDSTGESKPHIKPSAPNISLNITESASKTVLWTVAFIGIVLQFGVLLFDGFTTYHPTFKDKFKKNNRPIPKYAFPITAGGTLLVVAGMMICAYVVESATEEVDLHYIREKKVCSCMRLMWLQKHGKVGDQLFDSYVIFARGSRASIRTSRRREFQIDHGNHQTASQGQQASQPSSCHLKEYSYTRETGGICTLGTMTSVVGFTAQFMGLRSMPWTATIAQLVATGIMTGLRVSVRTAGLTQEPDTYKLPHGYELDWLATRMGSFQDTPLASMLSDSNMGQGFWTQTSWKWSVVTGQCAYRYQASGVEPGDQTHESRSWSSLRNSRLYAKANKVVAARIRLQALTKWTRDGSMTSCLIKAIEQVMNTIFYSDDVILQKKNARYLEFEWPIFIRFDGTEEPYFFKLSRRSTNAPWKIRDPSGFEAILSLWRFTLQQEGKTLVQAVQELGELGESASEIVSISGSEYTVPQPEHNDESDQTNESEGIFAVLRFLGPSNPVSRRDYRLWIHQGTESMTYQCGKQDYGYPAIGFPVNPLQPGTDESLMDRDSDTEETDGTDTESDTHDTASTNSPLEDEPDSDSNHDDIFPTSSPLNINEPDSDSNHEDIFPTSSQLNIDETISVTGISIHNDVTSKDFNIDKKASIGSDFNINDNLSSTSSDPNIDDISFMYTNEGEDDESASNSTVGSNNESNKALCVVTTSSFERICAQDLFSTFMWYVACNVQSVVTKTVLATNPYPANRELWEPPSIRNAFLDTLVRAVETTELGVGEEISMSVIPPLRSAGILGSMDLDPSILVRHVKDKSALFESHQNWEESKKACLWLYNICSEYLDEYPDAFYEAAILLADFSVSVSDAASMCRQGSHDEPEHRKMVLSAISMTAFEEVQRGMHGNAIIKILASAYKKRTGGVKHFGDSTGTREPPVYGVNYAIAKLLDTRYAKGDSNEENILGWTPLHCATATMTVDNKKSPLRQRHTIVIDAKDRDGRTSLHWAILNKSQPWVEALLKAKSDRNSKDNCGRTPLYLALSSGLKSIANVLQEGGSIDGWGLYISETSDDNFELLLRGGGINLDVRDKDGRTPLRLALLAGRNVIARKLLEGNADPDAVVPDSGESALYPTAAGGDLEMTELLLKHNANPSHPTMYGWTPLHWAVGNGHEQVAKALLDKGANPSAVADTGKTPLHMAGNKDMRELVEQYISPAQSNQD